MRNKKCRTSRKCGLFWKNCHPSARSSSVESNNIPPPGPGWPTRMICECSLNSCMRKTAPAPNWLSPIFPWSIWTYCTVRISRNIWNTCPCIRKTEKMLSMKSGEKSETGFLRSFTTISSRMKKSKKSGCAGAPAQAARKGNHPFGAK